MWFSQNCHAPNEWNVMTISFGQIEAPHNFARLTRSGGLSWCSPNSCSKHYHISVLTLIQDRMKLIPNVRIKHEKMHKIYKEKKNIWFTSCVLNWNMISTFINTLHFILFHTLTLILLHFLQLLFIINYLFFKIDLAYININVPKIFPFEDNSFNDMINKGTPKWEGMYIVCTWTSCKVSFIVCLRHLGNTRSVIVCESIRDRQANALGIWYTSIIFIDELKLFLSFAYVILF